MHVDLVREPGVEVAALRTADQARMARRRELRVDTELLARLSALGRLAQALRRVGGGCRGGGEASRIEHGASGGARLLRVVLVAEVSVDCGRMPLDDVLAEVVEDAVALPGAEALLKAAEELRPACLVAAALADELVLEGVEGEDVVASERCRARPVGLEVAVDPLDEGVDVL